MVLLGDTFPNFTAETSTGKIKFHDWLGNSYVIISIILYFNFK